MTRSENVRAQAYHRRRRPPCSRDRPRRACQFRLSLSCGEHAPACRARSRCSCLRILHVADFDGDERRLQCPSQCHGRLWLVDHGSGYVDRCGFAYAVACGPQRRHAPGLAVLAPHQAQAARSGCHVPAALLQPVDVRCRLCNCALWTDLGLHVVHPPQQSHISYEVYTDARPTATCCLLTRVCICLWVVALVWYRSVILLSLSCVRYKTWHGLIWHRFVTNLLRSNFYP